MDTSLASLIRRVQAIIQEHGEWFELVANWYDHATKTKETVLKLWVPAVEPDCKPLLSVNGQFLDEGARDRRSSSHHLFWIIPPSSLRVGDNDIFLWMHLEKKSPLQFGAVTVEHGVLLPAEVQRDSRPQPLPTSGVSVTYRLGDGYRLDQDRWMTQIQHDTLKFHLHLAERVSPSFTLGVAVLLPGAGYEVDLTKVWEWVDDLIEDKIKELIKNLGENASSRVVEMQLQDLKAYQKLHRSQLKEALQADDGESLKDIMKRTQDAVERVKPPPVPKAAVGGVPLVVKLFVVLVMGAGALAVAWNNGWIDEGTWKRLQTALGNQKGGQVPPPEQERQNLERLQQQKAQGGDVQVSLFWHNKNDLDLHVICPSGERISFANHRSKCGGNLDVDMNVGGYATASAQPVENVFWPTGKAPKGRYKILVNHFTRHDRPDCQDPTSFQVRAVVRGQTRWFNGAVVNNDPARREALVHEFVLD